MTFEELPIGERYTTAPSGNGDIYTKTGKYRASFVGLAGITIAFTVLYATKEVYPVPSYRRHEGD